jgi:hypothetical protein
MDKEEHYNFSDFTQEHYRDLILLAQKRFTFIQYDQAFEETKSPVALWRHDIDISMNRALVLAKIEHESAIKSTYFIQLGSNFYNCFEEEIRDKVNEILSLGHSIGLHFHAQFYKINTKEELENKLHFEKEVLETVFQYKIKVFSFHNPSVEILDKFADCHYSGLINTYSVHFRNLFGYCSDSNGYWRHDRLEDFIKNTKHKKIQILTHPEWWQVNAMSPQERVWRSIDGRASFNKKWYLEMLEKGNRMNVS